MKVFKTVRAAAIAGCKEANPLTAKSGNEWGGLIFKVPRGFSYSPPGTSGDPASINPADIFAPYVPEWTTFRDANDREGAAKALRDANIVAFYHIHPCTRGTDRTAKYFSGGDMTSMVISGFSNAYMAVNCTGKVYEINLHTEVIYPDPGDFYNENPASLGTLIGTV